MSKMRRQQKDDETSSKGSNVNWKLWSFVQSVVDDEAPSVVRLRFENIPNSYVVHNIDTLLARHDRMLYSTYVQLTVSPVDRRASLRSTFFSIHCSLASI
jgi:hypothetical protein